MSITAFVENDTIKLPPEMHVPNGTKVEVRLETAGETGRPPESFYDTIRDLIGSVDGLPGDFAAEHDHYIHGMPRRLPQ